MNEHTADCDEALEYRVCWLTDYDKPIDHTSEDGAGWFTTLDEALEWDPINCAEFLTWVEVRPAIEWSTSVIPPAVTDDGDA